MIDSNTGLADDIPLETVQSALSYQITKYGLSSATNSKTCLACMANSIVQHLRTLIAHKSVSENRSLRLAYNGMLIDWERIKLIHTRERAEKHRSRHYH
ncbi:MAG: hypothetical protein KDJ38_06525 [Gammaproteobacteria bacterium]|nr:hypothetical protein [Gammaproteobacteria bacterium]